ncbi:MAG: hypothetical protein D6763_01890 [Alphaproteobacteria bacterium]|nr:MAG: hypothetical protein D6763_01890 [Alphaproteobacteria bacterium]
MTMRKLLILSITLLLAGCARYSLVEPGTTSAGAMSVTPTQAWNKATGGFLGREYWTQDGTALNVILFINGIADGEPLFKARKTAQFGAFRATMLPHEIMELTESSLAKAFGSTATATSNLRPVEFMGATGFAFNYSFVTQADVPTRGLARGVVKDGKLYMILYQAAETYYYEAGLPEAEQIMNSARES